MIAIDTLFFLVEIVSGFLAHSLALMADAFHMVSQSHLFRAACESMDRTSANSAQLNDIISLVIGLWAVSAAQKTSTDEFTFGVRLPNHRVPFNADAHV